MMNTFQLPALSTGGLKPRTGFRLSLSVSLKPVLGLSPPVYRRGIKAEDLIRRILWRMLTLVRLCAAGGPLAVPALQCVLAAALHPHHATSQESCDAWTTLAHSLLSAYTLEVSHLHRLLLPRGRTSLCQPLHLGCIGSAAPTSPGNAAMTSCALQTFRLSMWRAPASTWIRPALLSAL